MREKLHDWKYSLDCIGLTDIVPLCNKGRDKRVKLSNPLGEEGRKEVLFYNKII